MAWPCWRAWASVAPADALCVVMITGGGSEALAVRALNNGALDYLVKQQFDRELLQKTVRHAIEKNEWRQYQARYHSELQGMNRQLRDSLAELTETRQELHEKNAQLSPPTRKSGRATSSWPAPTRTSTTSCTPPATTCASRSDNLRGLFEELRHSATFHDPEAAIMLRLFDDSLQQPLHHHHRPGRRGAGAARAR